MNNSCVIGWGTVGKATAQSFGIEKHYSRTQSNMILEEAAKCRFIFLCLPTPTIDGVCFTDDLFTIIKQINTYAVEGDNPIFIIRSTVYPGFAQKVRSELGIQAVVSNPESLSEDTWKQDAEQPDLIVIGGDDAGSREAVKGLYQSRFKHLDPLITSNTTAELIKWSLNAFFITKVVFANAIYDYAQKVGANYEQIKDVMETHRWGSVNHWRIFDKGGRGAAGKCLKKDIEAITHATQSPFFHTVFALNEDLLAKSGKVNH